MARSQEEYFARNRKDWDDFITICERDTCSRCGSRHNLQQHHKEPLNKGDSRFGKHRPFSIDLLYELIVECKPLCAKCHGDTHEHTREDNRKLNIDTTKELTGDLGWPETTPKKVRWEKEMY